MNVLILAVDDWGNSGCQFAKALVEAGHHVAGIKRHPHPFNYVEQLPVCEFVPDDIVEQADVLFYVHTVPLEAEQRDIMEGKAVVVHHGGSSYRCDPDAANAFWNPRAHAAVIETPDLFGKGAENETLVYSPIDVDALPLVARDFSMTRMFIGHYPSAADKKGTEVIAQVLHNLKGHSDLRDRFEFEIGTDFVPHVAQIERLRRCDVYIDQLMPELWGKPCGEFGIAAREAAALGAVVVTNHLNAEVYAEQYGAYAPVVRAASAEELAAQLRTLILMKRHQINALQYVTREWVVLNHSYKAAGQRLTDRVLTPALMRKDTCLSGA